jgi:hypothetical protein
MPSAKAAQDSRFYRLMNVRMQIKTGRGKGVASPGEARKDFG